MNSSESALPPADRLAGCELCAVAASAATLTVWASERLRVVRVLDAPDFPAFYRVIWNAHRAEFTDLAAMDRLHCIEVVSAVERVLREQLAPDKINLASLGNVVAHLHWHVIARWRWDSHFPQPIWGRAQRHTEHGQLAAVQARLPQIDQVLATGLTAVA
jgi:diadenosine tetraphosphate (Ap4A) HIT family hydrolase